MKIRQTIFLCFFLFQILQIKFAQSVAKDLNEAIAQFGKKLYTYLARTDKTGNILISSYAIQRILVLLTQAAHGLTRDELRTALELSSIPESKYLNAFGKQPSEFVCNDYFYASMDIKLRLPFELISQLIFGIHVQHLDFQNAEETASIINEQIEESSGGLIRKFIRKKEIKNTPSICLFNSALFKGDWKMPFDKKLTRISKFYNFGTEEVLVSALYNVQLYGYAVLKDLKATALSIPYANSDDKLLILLPQNRNGLESVERRIKRLDFSLLLRKLRITLVAASLPQFSIDYKVNVSSVLAAFGVNTLFSPDADLSDGLETTSNLNSSCLLSKFHFDVNEHGSSGDFGEHPTEKASDSPEKFFLLEHPFLFFVHTNDVINFSGRIRTLNIHNNQEHSAEASTKPPPTKANSSEEED